MATKKTEEDRKTGEKRAKGTEEPRVPAEEYTPEQPLGTDNPRAFEPSDLAPAASGDMDHLNPGVPGDLPNELPAQVPTTSEMAITGGIGPIAETAQQSQVNAGTKVRGREK